MIDLCELRAERREWRRVRVQFLLFVDLLCGLPLFASVLPKKPISILVSYSFLLFLRLLLAVFCLFYFKLGDYLLNLE